MAEGLSRKKRIRGGHRSSTTRIISQIYESVESTDEVESVMTKLRQCKLVLQEKLEIIKQLDDEILQLVDDEEVENEIEQADTFKERVQRAMIDSSRALETRESMVTITPTNTHRRDSSSPPTPTVPTATSASTSLTDSPGLSVTTAVSSGLVDIPVTSSAITSTPAISSTLVSTHAGDLPSSLTAGHTKVKLPKLALKRFNGDLTRWATFWDSFESSIHNHPGLSDIDKFNYLNTLLEGPASEAISGLKLTTANYSEAVAILKRRFGRKQIIIAKHMEVLLSVDVVMSEHNLKGLRHLYDVVEAQVRGLKSLGVPAEAYGSLLTSVLLNKLPRELRLVVSRQMSEEEWTLDSLMEVLEREITARERAVGTSNQVPRRHNRELPTATALLTSSLATPKCSYCRQNHPSSSCRSVLDVAARKQILRRAGRCFVCLRKNHMSRECRSTVKCSNCGGRHHTSICSVPPAANARIPRASNNQQEQPPLSQQQGIPINPTGMTAPMTGVTSITTPTTSALHCVATKVPVLLQTARAMVFKISDVERKTEARIMFDNGSQRSYITNTLAETLSLTSKHTETMVIRTFGSQSETKQICDVVSMGIALRNGQSIQLSFLTVPLICEPLTSQPIMYAKENCDHLTELDLADCAYEDDKLSVDILVGSDNYWQLVTGEIINGDCGPTAIKTRLGWVLTGPVEGISNHSSTNLVVTHTLTVDTHVSQDSDQELDEKLKTFWDLESLGIQPNKTTVYDEFENTIQFNGERYEVSLPWKVSHDPLSNNYDLSLKRLVGLLKRLRQNPEILCQYDAVIHEQIQRGIVESVGTQMSTHNLVHYLPHHAVLREDKATTKLRIVYDASSKTCGPSLNDCLYTGPKSGQKIMDILLRFRTHRIAMAADIEKAFLMISVRKEDRDALRFLWVKDLKSDAPEVTVLRFTRVVFGVSASPFLLNATIKHHMERYSTEYPELVSLFMRSIYVDDVSYGADDEDTAFELYMKSKEILAKGGFNLRKFVTNSTKLNHHIGLTEQGFNVLQTSNKIVEEDKSYTKDILGDRQCVDGEQKILGVKWNFIQDDLIFDLTELTRVMNGAEATKRHIIGASTRFYDPLGFMSPVVIRFKMFFQELCVSKIGWDEPLTGQLLTKWNTLLSGFKGVVTSIPRCYFWNADKSSSVCSLHGFCDASLGAYAAVVYMKVEASCGNCVNFVASKTRVAPVNKQTIPRLELLSALLLANLVDTVYQALNQDLVISSITCYTDSKVSLFWIKGIGKEWKPFIQNRVKGIRKLVAAEKWTHCRGEDNPADIPSRGVTTTELAGSTLWRHGPSWLVGFTTGLNCDEDSEMPEACLNELKTTRHRGTHTLC